MKPFNFLSPKNTFNGHTFDPDIILAVYELCEHYKHFVESCRRVYLEDHPEIDPEVDEFNYPIPHNPIEKDFPEGKLWHAGSDYDEVEEKLLHMVFLDLNHGQNGDFFYFTVEETDQGLFNIIDVTTGNSIDDIEYDPAYN